MSKQDKTQDRIVTERLADLPVADEQAEEAKGGVRIKTYVCPSDPSHL
jgi:hypothetical protein